MATYYVDAVGGSNINSGTSEADAWGTIQFAIDNSINGDYIYVKASAVYSEALVIPANTGRRIIGYTSTLNDRGSFVLDGGNSLATGIAMSNSSGASIGNNLRLANIEIRNYTSHGLSYTVSSGDNNNNNVFYNLWSHHNGGSGFYAATPSSRSELFARCTANDNTSDGFTSIRGATRCIAYNNGGHGFLNYGSVAYNAHCSYCIAYGNTLDGFSSVLSADHCIAYNNGSNGFSFASRANSCSSNIAQSNAAYGFNNIGNLQFVGAGNIAWLNTSGATSPFTPPDGWPPISEQVTEQDPGLADPVNADFTPSNAKIAIEIGLIGSFIASHPEGGPISPASAGGGGTRGYWG